MEKKERGGGIVGYGISLGNKQGLSAKLCLCEAESDILISDRATLRLTKDFGAPFT
jgi:hypothetical protein